VFCEFDPKLFGRYINFPNKKEQYGLVGLTALYSLTSFGSLTEPFLPHFTA
jgi:hypothetical protein